MKEEVKKQRGGSEVDIWVSSAGVRTLLLHGYFTLSSSWLSKFLTLNVFLLKIILHFRVVLSSLTWVLTELNVNKPLDPLVWTDTNTVLLIHLHSVLLLILTLSIQHVWKCSNSWSKTEIVFCCLYMVVRCMLWALFFQELRESPVINWTDWTWLRNFHFWSFECFQEHGNFENYEKIQVWNHLTLPRFDCLAKRTNWSVIGPWSGRWLNHSSTARVLQGQKNLQSVLQYGN